MGPGHPTGLCSAVPVQGAGARSPYVGSKVTTTGVVTGDFQGEGEYGGFFLQSPAQDGDPLTSDGIRVFQSTTAVAVGDVVTVTGTVEEFASTGPYPGSETQFGRDAVVTVTGTVTPPGAEPLVLPFAPTAGSVFARSATRACSPRCRPAWSRRTSSRTAGTAGTARSA